MQMTSCCCYNIPIRALETIAVTIMDTVTVYCVFALHLHARLPQSVKCHVHHRHLQNHQLCRLNHKLNVVKMITKINVVQHKHTIFGLSPAQRCKVLHRQHAQTSTQVHTPTTFSAHYTQQVQYNPHALPGMKWQYLEFNWHDVANRMYTLIHYHHAHNSFL